ncbi:ABC transporter permease subunit [Bradyrhizobium sp. IC3069]|uniref:ABC transporter permease n=1 Tax=unclassified Bradyrhizobium TaxID=2631580 RepID=UPI001CD3540D|nr:MULTISPECIES: ABC transporter permease subunit [unclassified Bradyrhizobium]MCA1363368.1 ABC transporter permease subunit [Bradyrhizobium sp. IC4059]MCA1520906.1 ABC transporter permease subunit [Bradyrhizobium sp. IC3069]
MLIKKETLNVIMTPGAKAVADAKPVFRKRTADAVLFFGTTAIIAATTVFLLFPVIVTVFMAFDARDYIGPFPPTELSMQWFVQLYESDYLWSAFNTSLLLATATTIAATAIGALAALAISWMSPRWRDLVTTTFLSPLVLPGVIIGFGLLMFLSIFDWLPVFPKLFAGHLIITLPFTIRMALVGLSGISEALREAALSLGANERQVFFTITLPLAKNGIAAGAVFAFATSMDDVAISLFLSDFNTYTLPVALTSLIKSSFDLTIATAAVALMGLTLVLLIVLDRVLGIERAIGHGTYRTR